MKTNIKQVGLWWRWDEYCDNCGKQTKKSEGFASMAEPEKEGKDYCLECLEKLLDDN